ncbi:LysR family transcriptional regulator [Sphingomonas sp. 1P08PE]|uniref:LysR family transcriptional regulator n=1 Tax=Sphingomonas sp. 1P08PE TaxID=554122 RepID=UPI0039A28F08
MDPAINLDQLLVFSAVAEEGSFSAAARKLDRSQSAVTYAVQKLEAATGMPLFDRSLYRPVLTKAGSALLPRARRVIETSAALGRQARSLREGIEPELFLVVDAMFPMPLLFSVLSDFDREYPSVRTRLHVESLGATVKAVVDGHADLGLIVDVAHVPDGLIAVALDAIELVTVVAPSHPLADVQRSRDGPLEDEDLRDHLQLVLTDRTDLTKGRDNGVVGVRTWRLGDLGAKHAMLLAGMGWGNMPLHMVATDLAERRLLVLSTARWPGHVPRLTVSTAIVHRQDRPPGIAGAWLFDRMTKPG